MNDVTVVADLKLSCLLLLLLLFQSQYAEADEEEDAADELA